MRTSLLFVLLLVSIDLFGQEIIQENLEIEPMQTRVLQKKVFSGDSIIITVRTAPRQRKQGLLKFVPFAVVPTINAGNLQPDQKYLPTKGFAGMSVASFLPLLSRKGSGKLKIFVTVTSSDETPDQSRQLTDPKHGVYEWRGIATNDSFIRTEFVNSDKHSVSAIVSVISKPGFLSPTRATRPVKFPPIVNTEVPIGDPYDGGTFDEAVIIAAKTENGDFQFQAPKEANFGPSESWTVSSAGGAISGDGGTGDSGGEPQPPGAEEKAVLRNLNEFDANKCEARYILDHLMDSPTMGGSLILNKRIVENYMTQHNMAQANADGAAIQNAFKHAYFAALNYCGIGGQHAMIMADLHEVCEGRNMNNTLWRP